VFETIIPPDMDDLLLELKNEIFAQLNCVQIGKISKVNDDQTVELELQVKRRVRGEGTTSYPVLADCPYFVLSGGGAYLDMPITAGDYCIVLFNDRNLDTWWDSGNIAEPADRRKHSLSDGIALVGIQTKDNALEQDGSFVRLLGVSGPGAEEAPIKGETFQTDLQTFLNAVISATATVGSSAQNAAALTAIGVAANTFLSAVPGMLSTEVKIG
jgi:hypothetical protein